MPVTKRHIVVNRAATPLGVTLDSANRHDNCMLVPTLDAVPGVCHGRDRPRRHPAKLHAAKAYDYRRCRVECRARSITPRIARRGGERNGTLMRDQTLEPRGRH